MIVLLVGRKLQSKCFIFQAVYSYGFAGGIFYNIKLKPFKILISRSKSSYIPWRFFEGVQAYNIRLENIQRPRKYAISQVDSEPYLNMSDAYLNLEVYQSHLRHESFNYLWPPKKLEATFVFQRSKKLEASVGFRRSKKQEASSMLISIESCCCYACNIFFNFFSLLYFMI